MTTSANTNTGLSKKNITASNCSKRLTGKVDMTLIQKSTISPSETHDAISQKIKSILKLLFQQFNKMKNLNILQKINIYIKNMQLMGVYSISESTDRNLLWETDFSL